MWVALLVFWSTVTVVHADHDDTESGGVLAAVVDCKGGEEQGKSIAFYYTCDACTELGGNTQRLDCTEHTLTTYRDSGCGEASGVLRVGECTDDDGDPDPDGEVLVIIGASGTTASGSEGLVGPRTLLVLCAVAGFVVRAHG
jgi:hypothetical protein